MEYHSAVNFRGDVYVFGGGPDVIQSISAFRFNGSWTRIQSLARTRIG